MHHAALSLLFVSAIHFVGCTPSDEWRGGHAMTSSPNAADAPFDLPFLDTMTSHHQGAIAMARMATKAQHDELGEMAVAIVTDQRREIDQMKKWRKTWFADQVSRRPTTS